MHNIGLKLLSLLFLSLFILTIYLLLEKNKQTGYMCIWQPPLHCTVFCLNLFVLLWNVINSFQAQTTSSFSPFCLLHYYIPSHQWSSSWKGIEAQTCIYSRVHQSVEEIKSGRGLYVFRCENRGLVCFPVTSRLAAVFAGVHVTPHNSCKHQHVNAFGTRGFRPSDLRDGSFIISKARAQLHAASTKGQRLIILSPGCAC